MASLLSKVNQAMKQATRPWCSVIVPAAGNATRMEGKDKILSDIGGRPVIVHTIEALQNCPYVDEIIIVTREELMQPIGELVVEANFRKVVRILRGGASRAESVWLGLGHVNPKAELIGIHDGARPFVSQKLLEEVFTRAVKAGAAAPAVPVKDTIKEVDKNGIVVRTVERENLRAVQTPQVFEASIIKAALQVAVEKKLPITDDCSAVELLGKRVLLTKGDYDNIKITTPGDLVLGEAILKWRQG